MQGQQQQFMQGQRPMYGPPPPGLQQGGPGGPQGPRMMGPNQQQQNMAMNNYGQGGVPAMAGPQGPKDDYRKVGLLWCIIKFFPVKSD